MGPLRAMSLRSLCLGSVFALSVPAAALASMINGTGDPLGAIPGGSQITFESVTPGTYNSFSVAGVTFTADPGTSEYVNGDYSGAYNTTGQSLQNTYADDAFATLTILFNSPVQAFAFNWGAADTQWTLTAYDASDSVIDSFDIAPTFGANDGTYDGLSSSSANIVKAVLTVDLANLETDLPDYVFIDNFSCSGEVCGTAVVGEVPEPISLALMGTGLAGMSIAKRRRKSK